MSKKVLIIEDEAQIRKLIFKSIKRSFGTSIDNGELTLLEAVDGLEGLEIAKEEMPDLVFLDVMLPKMDGFEVCRQIRNDNNINHICIVMLTAKLEVFEGKIAGADEYMAKPFEPDFIVSKVEEKLEISRN